MSKKSWMSLEDTILWVVDKFDKKDFIFFRIIFNIICYVVLVF